MSTCYLFSQSLNEEGCLSILCDETGLVLEPLAFRPFADIQKLQKEHKTWLIIPTSQASLFTVTLPWLAEKKARTALPYALEDQLAQTVENLHIAFDKRFYQDQRYLIAVLDKSYLQNLMLLLNNAGIHLTGATLDWFALSDQEGCFTESALLVNSPDYKGILIEELIPVFQKGHLEMNWLSASDSIKPAE